MEETASATNRVWRTPRSGKSNGVGHCVSLEGVQSPKVPNGG